MLKEVAKKSRTAIIAHKIYENWRMKRQFSSGNFESLHGSTHGTIIKNLSESIGYINVQFRRLSEILRSLKRATARHESL